MPLNDRSADRLATRSTLLERVRNAGDQGSWKEFYKLYQPLIYRYSRGRGLSREEAEELTQQCMGRLVEAMGRFEYRKERGGFKAWLRCVTNNRIADHFRKRQPAPARTADLRRPQTREETPDELWEREWQKRHLRHFLAEIRAEVAEGTFRAFECHVLQEWPVPRVCETLGITADQVYAAKSRITRKLREKMNSAIGN